MSHTFISYMRTDQRAIDQLVAILRHHGVNVWIDRKNIKPGQRWQLAIRRAIKDGAFFLACFSYAYKTRESTYVNEELILAIEELRRRPVDRAWFIPILLDNSGIPERQIGAGEYLSDLQCIDLSGSWQEGINQLLEAIGVKQSPNAPDEVPAGIALSTYIDPLLSSLYLEKLDVTWQFDNVPEKINELVKIGYATVDAQWFRDDELSRYYSRETQDKIYSGLTIEKVLPPALFAISNPTLEPNESLSGDLSDLGEFCDVEYKGPHYKLLVPVNASHSAALALGAREDDSHPIDATNLYDSEIFYAELSNHGFTANVDSSTNDLKLTFQYGPASLNNAVQRAFPGQRISALLSNRFNLVVVHSSLNKENYVSEVGRIFSLETPEREPFRSQPFFEIEWPPEGPEQEGTWANHSMLRIIVNDLDLYTYTYEVKRLGHGASFIEGAMGESFVSFTYTLFQCIRYNCSK